jgi:uncharacterized protein
MKFTLDSRSDINLIRGYAAGEVRIGELVQHAPCIVSADQLILDWRAHAVASLTAEDLEPIFALQPDVVLLGSGLRQTFPASAIKQVFVTRRIGLEAMDLGAACRTYKILVQEERRVVAALFPSG